MSRLTAQVTFVPFSIVRARFRVLAGAVLRQKIFTVMLLDSERGMGMLFLLNVSILSFEGLKSLIDGQRTLGVESIDSDFVFRRECSDQDKQQSIIIVRISSTRLRSSKFTTVIL